VALQELRLVVVQVDFKLLLVVLQGVTTRFELSVAVTEACVAVHG
jgi:hypothetical protein